MLAAIYALARGADEAAWRDGGRGAVEVARMTKGRFERFAVNVDGTSTLVTAEPPSQRHRFAIGVGLTALAVAGGAIALGFGFGARVGFHLVVGVFLVGFGLAAVAAFAGAKGGLGSRIGSRDALGGEWFVVPYLGGWAPSTIEQLRAVEELAEAGDGRAYVREVDDGAVEAVTRESRRVRRRLVFVDGATTPLHLETDEERFGRLFRVLASIGGGYAVAVLAPVPGVLAGGALVASMVFAGWLWDDLARRARKGGGSKRDWFVVRTRRDDDGG